MLAAIFACSPPPPGSSTEQGPASGRSSTGDQSPPTSREQPVIVKIADVVDDTVAPLQRALAALDGIERAEVVAGEERLARLYVRPDFQVSARLLEPILAQQRLTLTALELPDWAQMRFYSVEASGGG